MSQAIKTSISGIRNDVLVYGVICCICYIIFLLIMKALNFVEHSGFRIVNYLMLLVITFIQVKSKIKRTGKYVPFLQVFSIVFSTGTLSSVLFSLFLIVYSFYDPLLSKLLIYNAPEYLRAAPAVILLVEGTGASVIIALISMVYFIRYEDGETKTNHT